jgi:hypothetical protein
VLPDVLPLSPSTDETVAVAISLSGPAADVVQRAGFWDEELGVASGDLELVAGASAQIAFALDPGESMPEGGREGTLTISATTPDGSTLHWDLLISLLLVPAGESPDETASPAPAITTADRVPLRRPS